ncbi:hypothetical protein DDI_2525 [Dickeya dianthicola RNS04.9]|nr:hypothetical protein DDI_2525 [Dickeya dianthicola RNS04.9]
MEHHKSSVELSEIVASVFITHKRHLRCHSAFAPGIRHPRDKRKMKN